MAPLTGTVITDWTVNLTSAEYAGKSLLVIGGTAGLGQAIAREAVKLGCANVTVVGRSFKEDPATTTIKFVQADLSLMKEAKKIGESIATADIVVLTTGIVANKERQVTEEGLEMDMAVSYLSRLTILHYLLPRLKKNARVFVMGFPGANQTTYRLEDLNSEMSYEGGFGFVHMNTVIGNEALVLYYAKETAGFVSFFGLNPGIIKTGIRGNMYTSGLMYYLGPVLEFVMGFLTTSPTGYAQKITPLLFAKELDEHTGSMFNPSAQPVLKSTFMEEEFVQNLVKQSKKLVEEKSGVSLGYVK